MYILYFCRTHNPSLPTIISIFLFHPQTASTISRTVCTERMYSDNRVRLYVLSSRICLPMGPKTPPKIAPKGPKNIPKKGPKNPKKSLIRTRKIGVLTDRQTDRERNLIVSVGILGGGKGGGGSNDKLMIYHLSSGLADTSLKVKKINEGNTIKLDRIIRQLGN